MLLQILAALACLIGAVLQLAVYRSPDVVDSVITKTARKITIAALFVSALYIVYSLKTFGYAPNPLCLVLGLMGLGQILFAVNNLLKYLEKGHPQWSSHLSNSK